MHCRLFLSFDFHIVFCLVQWRIQDFPEWGAPIPKFGLFCKFFGITAWKWKNLDPRGTRVPGAPLRSANAVVQFTPFSEETLMTWNPTDMNQLNIHVATQILKRGANLLFGQNLPKTAWKWRKFDQRGDGMCPKFYYVLPPLITFV